jgi:putative ABC transport system ATP-binding protein
VNDPDILVADEPTSNIDQDSAAGLLEILAALKKDGKTIIVSSHDPVFRNHCDVLFTLRRGALEGTERGEPQEGGVTGTVAD